MQKIFLAYANARDEQRLPTLQEEEEKVFSILSQREKRHHFSLYRDNCATIPNIVEYLGRYRDQIIIFHYSGHAGADSLLLEDEAANADGIAGLLSHCPQLQLAVLNGCSTNQQVEQLLVAGLPAVIATSAAVGDDAATRFAIAFYQSLAENNCTLKDAFNFAVAATQMKGGLPLVVETRAGRPAAVGEAGWGLYYKDEAVLAWKLPSAADQRPVEGSTVQQAENIINIGNIGKANFS